MASGFRRSIGFLLASPIIQLGLCVAASYSHANHLMSRPTLDGILINGRGNNIEHAESSSKDVEAVTILGDFQKLRNCRRLDGIQLGE